MAVLGPFEEADVDEAAQLFVDNYNLLLGHYPAIPTTLSNHNTVSGMLGKLIATNPAVVAREEKTGRLLGYMVGFSQVPHLKGSSLGAYVPEWGHAVASGEDKERLYYDLYSAIADKWVADKCLTHLITFYAHDTVLKSLLFDLSFGLLVIDALAPLNTPGTRKKASLVVREATDQDLPVIRWLDHALEDHLSTTPVFLHVGPNEATDDDLREEYLGSGVKTFLAEEGDPPEVVGGIRAMLHKGPGCASLQGEGTLGINFAFTQPSVREKGVAGELLGHLMAWGREHQMRRCAVDFESQNLSAKKFWMKVFDPICYSCIRKVDERTTTPK